MAGKKQGCCKMKKADYKILAFFLILQHPHFFHSLPQNRRQEPLPDFSGCGSCRHAMESYQPISQE